MKFALRALSVALCLAFVVGWLWQLGGRGDRGAALVPRPAAEAPADRIPAALGEPPGLADDARAEIADVAPQTTRQPLAGSSSVPIRFAGDLLARDTQGQRLAAPNGSLLLVLGRQDAEERQELQVTGGLWSTEVEEPELVRTVSIAWIRIDGRKAQVRAPTKQVPFVPEWPLHVAGQFTPQLTLSVLDADSLTELNNVTLREQTFFDLEHPGAAELGAALASDLSSPINLGPYGLQNTGRRALELLVWAPGHAWQGITAEFRQDCALKVLLPLAGTLRVNITSPRTVPGAQLRLYRADRPHSLTPAQPVVTGSFEFKDLAPGEYRVCVELGDPFGVTSILGEAPAKVAPGESTTVELQLEELPAAQPVMIRGQLLVPTEWQTEWQTDWQLTRTPFLTLTLLDPPLSKSSRKTTLRSKRVSCERAGYVAFEFEFKRPQPGRYSLRSDEPPVTLTFTVHGDQDPPIELVLPAPTNLDLDVFSLGTDQPLRSAEVHWRGESLQGLHLSGLGVAPWNEAQGCFRIQATTGTLKLRIEAEGHLPKDMELDLPPAGKRERILLEPCGTLRLELCSGTLRLPFPEGWSPFVADDSAEGGVSQVWTSDSLERVLQLRASENHSIEPPSLPGYQRPEPRTVQLAPGEWGLLRFEYLPDR